MPQHLLFKTCQEKGVYYRAKVDLTNHLVRLICKPKDVAAFKAPLTNERSSE